MKSKQKQHNAPGEDTEPDFVFSVASPRGDLPVSSDTLQVFLEGCGSLTTYGEYFSAIQHVLSKANLDMLRILASSQGHCVLPKQIHVRAEKHGALYHPASLEFFWAEGAAARFAMLVAVSERGQEALRRESLVLDHLQDSFRHRFCPKKLHITAHDGMTFLLTPWFSGFHEFHMGADGAFCLWDHDQGLRRIPANQARHVFFQAARILTLYVDAESGACIHPWSHAAGDFIVGMDERDVRVRLSTARGYGPLLETKSPLSALFAFFLDLALRMRLDRVDGVGEWVWLGPDVLENAVHGFTSAVRERGESEESLGLVARVLPTFSASELLDGHEPLLGFFSAAELTVILPRLESHCRELKTILATPNGEP